ETWLEFDLGARQYSRDDSSKDNNLPEGTQISLLTAKREQVSQQRGRVRFFPDGTSTGGAVRLISDACVREIKVDWFNGAVTVNACEEG
ncbi:MAG: GspH/FimT family pseudopilin, partial [Alphaproteobacteria bacterium]